jgi:hypothetical protein
MLAEAGAVAFPSSPITYAHDRATTASPTLHHDIARELQKLGFQPGDRVAMVDGDLPYYWARLARARITMEIFFDRTGFDPAAEWLQAQKIASEHGAAFVIAPRIAGVVDQPGWRELGNTGAFAYDLRRAGPTSPVPDSH